MGEVPADLDRITEGVIGAAIAVHREPGPGSLESSYEACLAFELTERGFRVERQKVLPVVYKGGEVECGDRLDLLVNDSVVVELKTVDSLSPLHEAQLLSYLRLSGCPLGLPLNFHTRLLTQGIKRMAMTRQPTTYPDS